MATPALVQKGKNSVVYATNALQVALPAAATAGNALIIAIEAAKITDPFSVAQMAAGADRIDGSTLVTAPPVVKDNLGNTFSAIESLINFDGDLGYFSTTYLYYAANVAGGNKTFTVAVADVNGRPTFDHGFSVQVYEFSGIATSTPLDGHSSALSSANPAVSGSISTTVSGDLVFIVGHARKTGAISVPAGYTLLDTGRVYGTPNDYHITGFLAGSIASQTATITNIAIASNVLTVTATNTYQAGALVTASGVTTNSFLNGHVLTVTASTGSTFTAAFTHADVSSGADTGTVTGGPALLPTGATQPGFVNPGQYKVGVAILALKHS